MLTTLPSLSQVRLEHRIGRRYCMNNHSAQCLVTNLLIPCCIPDLVHLCESVDLVKRKPFVIDTVRIAQAHWNVERKNAFMNRDLLLPSSIMIDHHFMVDIFRPMLNSTSIHVPLTAFKIFYKPKPRHHADPGVSNVVVESGHRCARNTACIIGSSSPILHFALVNK